MSFVLPSGARLRPPGSAVEVHAQRCSADVVTDNSAPQLSYSLKSSSAMVYDIDERTDGCFERQAACRSQRRQSTSHRRSWPDSGETCAAGVAPEEELSVVDDREETASLLRAKEMEKTCASAIVRGASPEEEEEVVLSADAQHGCAAWHIGTCSKLGRKLSCQARSPVVTRAGGLPSESRASLRRSRTRRSRRWQCSCCFQTCASSETPA